MPIGHVNMGEHLLDAFRKVNPKKVLEIGVGYGYWGVTLRNYFGERSSKGALSFHNFQLDGVEVHSPYRNPFYTAYNNILEGNIEDHLDILENYDLIVIIDVVEHMSKELVHTICKNSKNMLLGVCSDMQEDQARDPFSNKYENHVTYWTPKDFKKLGFKIKPLNPLYFSAERIMVP